MSGARAARRRSCTVAALVVAVGAWLAPPAVALPGLTTGFNAQGMGLTAAWLDRAAGVRAGMIRLNVTWSAVAPTGPQRPADPADPGYRWSALDRAVRDVSARGMAVLLTFLSAPSWAEGPNRDRGAPAGTWRPSARALGLFATAAARRYSGTYPDPQSPGASLPLVRYWQAWNEPNLWVYLTPQWMRRGGEYRLASPGIYRSMLNAVYAAVMRVRAGNLVASAGTAPYGDPSPGARRVAPVRFTRALLCLRGRALDPARCPHPAHLDAIAHHPYGVRGPRSHALNPDDAAVPDIERITRVLRAAERARRVLPAGRKRVWVTEISWDSSPPDPDGVPVARHALWLETADYVLWRQGVDTVLWLQVVDSPPTPDYASTYQAGLFLLDGTAKPAATVFRFPFVVTRVRGKRFSAWGRAPAGGTVAVQRAGPAGWQTVRQVQASRDGVFLTTLRLGSAQTLRAVQGAEASLPWRVRAP